MIKKLAKTLTPHSVILILHIIGIIGLQMTYSQEFFARLTPLNLWVTAIIIVYAEKKKDALFWLFALSTFVFGMSIEIVGVQTTMDFATFVMKHPAFTSGDFDTHFVSKHFDPKFLIRDHKDEAEIAALIAATEFESLFKSQEVSNTTAKKSSLWKTNRKQ